jgi:hypothetical protein
LVQPKAKGEQGAVWTLKPTGGKRAPPHAIGKDFAEICSDKIHMSQMWSFA